VTDATIQSRCAAQAPSSALPSSRTVGPDHPYTRLCRGILDDLRLPE
jgi:hypothetical protein